MKPGVFWNEAYRQFFPVMALAGAAGLVGWAVALRGGLSLSPLAHGAYLIWGVFGTGVLGFLFTAYPRQNEAPPPGRAALVAALLAQLAAAGAAWHGPLGVTGAIVGALPWLGALLWALPIATASLRRRWDDTTAAVPAALAMGGLGAAIFHAGDPRLGLDLGLHGLLVAVALAVLDRVLPFFCSKAVPGYDGFRRPRFAPLLLGAVLLRVGLRDHPAVGDVAMLAVLARQISGWRPWPAMRTPMIGVLYLGLAWIAAGYALDLAMGPPGRALATHAWMVGGLGTLLFGVSMRVARGHAGLPIQMGADGAALLALVQLAAILRLALAPLGWPALAIPAGALALAFAGWLARLGPLMLRKGG